MDHHRRRFLQLGGITAVTALAGCAGPGGDSGSDGTPEGTPSGTPSGTPTDDGQPGLDTTTEIGYGGWFSETSNFDGTTVDARGRDSVTVAVGAQGNGGALAFAPPAIWVAPGTTVEWEWTGNGGAHNVVSAGSSDTEFGSGDAVDSSDETFYQTFDEAGNNMYYCSPHQSLGMHGAVIVQEA